MYRLVRNTPPADRGKEGVPPPPVFPAANAPEVQAERSAHLANQMRELGIIDRLRKLSERDPDREVRRQAAAALKELTPRPARP
jgi:hypothetical protein